MRSAIERWLEARTVRERRLLVVAVSVSAVIGLGVGADTLRRDLDRLHRRVATAERRLAEARILAGRIEARSTGASAPSAPLVATLESTANLVLGPNRLTSLEPLVDAEGEHARARLHDLSLAELARLLWELERDETNTRGRHLVLVQHPEQAGRYDATLEVGRAGRVP